MKIRNAKGMNIEISKDTINELVEKFYGLTHEIYMSKYGNDKRRNITSKWRYYYDVTPNGKYVSTSFMEQLAMKFALTTQQVDEILNKLGYEKEDEKRGFKLLEIEQSTASSNKKLIL